MVRSANTLEWKGLLGSDIDPSRYSGEGSIVKINLYSAGEGGSQLHKQSSSGCILFIVFDLYAI